MNFSFTPLAGSYQRWGVGNDNWQGQSGAQIVPDYHAPTIFYRRFTVPELVNPNGTYTFTRFNSFINAAIQNRQLFGFRIFTMYAWPECPDCHNFTPFLTGLNGSTGNTVTAMSAVPLEWHTAMQASSPRNWISESGDWVPAYNSSAFLTRFAALHEAINTNIMTGSFTPTWSATPINYRDVIAYIDVSGFGTWGEWHSYASAFNNVVTTYPGYGLTAGNDQIAGSSFPTIATMKAIIDAHKNAYDNFQLAIIINAFDNMRLPNTRIPTEVGVYAYQTRTASGRWMGRRIDHAGDDTGYDDFYLQLNTGVFGGYRMDTAHNFRHRLAPFYGEPPGGPVFLNGINQGRLPSQARKWHWTSIGNGNWGGTSGVPTGQGADSVRLAFSIMGYHLRLTGGSAVPGASFIINLNWRNFGLTPTYSHWTVQYSLRNGAGTTVWTGNSAFDPYLFSPEDGQQTKTDVFANPAIAVGTYGLYVTVKDPSGYMTPLQLQIQGRETATGAYFLGNVTLGGGTNQSPIANAGPNQTIVPPDNDALLTSASSSDPDGTIVSRLWSQVSGPNTATNSTPTGTTTTVGNLIGGLYEFNVTVTDDDGATGFDRVQITVGGNQPPVANAGANQSIALPNDFANLNGTGSTDDVSIASYHWQKISGPVSFTLVTPDASTTVFDDLTAGVYIVRLTVVDGSGLSSFDDVQITVGSGNLPPIANAGANIVLTSPINFIQLNGSASSDDVGIVSYDWEKVGGPVTFSLFENPLSPLANFESLVTGIYIVRLTVCDVQGLCNSDDVQVTVLGAPTPLPVANAGSNLTITLPTNFVTLNGTGSTGTIFSYSWTKQSGPATFSMPFPTQVQPNVTNLVAGVYVFRLTVTNSSGSSFDDVTITVLPAPNQAPIANAGGSTSITLPTNSVAASGSGSTDADGTITAYLWTFISGPAVAGFTAATSVNTTINNLTVAGTYTIRLRVTDNSGATDTDDKIIIVNAAANNSPVAIITGAGPTSMQLPANSASFTGITSTDDVGVTGYLWTQQSGPAAATISAPTSAATNFTNLVQGVYFFQLQVSDAGGLTDTDIIQVTVLAATPVRPILNGHLLIRTGVKFLPRHGHP